MRRPWRRGSRRFYLGRTAQGVVHLLFWTGIPGIIGFFEGIFYLLKSDAAWAEGYGDGIPRETSRVAVGCLVVVAVFVLLGFISMIGLIFLGSQVSTIQDTTGAPVSSNVRVVDQIRVALEAAGGEPASMAAVDGA